jgi:hypothetical protein
MKARAVLALALHRQKPMLTSHLLTMDEAQLSQATSPSCQRYSESLSSDHRSMLRHTAKILGGSVFLNCSAL